MPKLEEIDRNFAVDRHISDGEFHPVEDFPDCLYGLAGRDDTSYFRLPPEIAGTVNDGVLCLCRNMAGVCFRFSTNSDTLAVKAEGICNSELTPHMTAIGTYGFSLYAGTDFLHSYMPPIPEKDFTLEKSLTDNHPSRTFRDYTLYMPLYGGYRSVSVKIDKDAVLRPASPFRFEKPIVFYGSSITQGGCASDPGLAFTNILSRRMDLYVRNLGFSGSARGEQTMADYIASLDMEALVIDFDHNAPTPEALASVHRPFFETIRKAKPDLPILFASAIPCLFGFRNDERRAVIKETCQAALDAGDRHVYFASGCDFFDDESYPYAESTVDGVHPNDLGMFAMYRGFRKALESMENGKYKA